MIAFMTNLKGMKNLLDNYEINGFSLAMLLIEYGFEFQEMKEKGLNPSKDEILSYMASQLPDIVEKAKESGETMQPGIKELQEMYNRLQNMKK